jgi:cytochrome c oxidase assembly protein subunit 15
MNVDRRIGVWLAIWAGMLFVLILIGGATRLTESGLSITEWKPVTGIVPPLNDAEWQQAFDAYQHIPQYQAIHATMSLAGFKRIFLWEYTHRLWARLVGVAFAVPLAWLLVRGGIPARLRRRLVLLLVLLALQGALGWFMVASGLSVRIEVSQYRLAAHFAAALLIYGATVWTAADLLNRRQRSQVSGDELRRVRRTAMGVTGLTILTAIAGAFVAGLRAGHMFNTFPLMAGQVVPPGYALMSPWWRNLFENPAAAQFNHRVLAETTFVAILLLWFIWRRKPLPDGAPRAMARFAGAATLQVGLGIATLLLAVPVGLGVAHQAGAVVLVTAGLLVIHCLRDGPAID